MNGDNFQRKLLLQFETLRHFRTKILDDTRLKKHKKKTSEEVFFLNGGDGENRTHVRNGNKRTSTGVGLLFLSILWHEPIPYISIKHIRLCRVWL